LDKAPVTRGVPFQSIKALVENPGRPGKERQDDVRIPPLLRDRNPEGDVPDPPSYFLVSALNQRQMIGRKPDFSGDPDFEVIR
jgi:hypothetical protein